MANHCLKLFETASSENNVKACLTSCIPTHSRPQKTSQNPCLLAATLLAATSCVPQQYYLATGPSACGHRLSSSMFPLHREHSQCKRVGTCRKVVWKYNFEPQITCIVHRCRAAPPSNPGHSGLPAKLSNSHWIALGRRKNTRLL